MLDVLDVLDVLMLKCDALSGACRFESEGWFAFCFVFAQLIVKTWVDWSIVFHEIYLYIVHQCIFLSSSSFEL